jgi:hypothetical protein
MYIGPFPAAITKYLRLCGNKEAYLVQIFGVSKSKQHGAKSVKSSSHPPKTW